MNIRIVQWKRATEIVLLILMLSITGMTNAMAQQLNQTKLTEYSFHNLGTIEERVFLLHSIQENDYFSYVLSDDEGKIDIYVSDNYICHESNANSDFDFFLDNLNNEWTAFSNLDKIERGILFMEWRNQLKDEVFFAINEDFDRQLRSVNSTCGGALPFCTDIGSYEYPAGVNSGSGEGGPYYDCLYSQPNPAWYYMQIDQPGDLSINMYTTPAVDIDFVCWGPFNDMGNACSQLTINNVVSCSYSINYVEYCNINNAQSGQYYVLLITNYSNQPANIIFKNIGTGSTMNFQGVSSTITATANPIEGGTVSGSGEYEFGSTCTLTATANDGYSFKYWTENGVVVSYDAEYSFAVTFDRSFVANFTPLFSVTVSANPEEGGTVFGNGVYELDSICTVTATANDGYFFVNWTEDGAVVSNDTTYTFTVVHESNLIANFVVEGTIVFADAHVKDLCVANWDTDGDGELNQTEAAAVTSLDGVFMFDGDITSFNELQFFTGLTSFGEDEFNSCTNLTAITIPNAVASIGGYAFSDCSNLATITSYACAPPALGSYVFDNVPSAVVINVPCHTAALYQAADGWSNYSNYEEFEYGLCPIIFADDNVKAICVAHWDTNGDGELSYAEAAAVTNLGTYFKSTAITSFEELEYFTSLTSLPNTAFYGCTSLSSIVLPSSVSALGNGSFYNCTNLVTMTVYAETPPTVGTNAFKNVPTDMVVHVPCGTIEAYQNANGWSVFSVYDPCALPIVFADANVKALCVANWDTNGDGELSYTEAAAVTDLGEVFKNKTTITSFNELRYFTGLTSIGTNAFYYCTGLTSIEIPNSVTSIGAWAFQECTGLTLVEIPNSVATIGNSAFAYCSGMTSIEIPSSVTYIGFNSFRGCSSLEQIIVASDNAYYDSRENCNAIIQTNTNVLVAGCKTTVIPNSVTSIDECAFYGCTGLASIDIPNSVTSIGNSAFSYCTILTSVEIPSSVTSIGNYAFSYCISLTSVEIPNSVTSIVSYAFYFCDGLTSVIIGNSVTTVGERAFWGCSGLAHIIVDSGNSFFDSRNNCNAIIKTVTNELITGCMNTIIPDSVTSIKDGAFYGCSGMTFLTVLAEMPPTLGYNTFYGVNRAIPIYVPFGSAEAYQSEEYWNEFTNIIEMGSGVVSVIVNPTDGGTVTGTGYYSGGQVCVLTAASNPGFGFGNWTENGRVISVDSVFSFYAHPTTLVANFCSNSPIVFADANVKALCVANWDNNGDGELSYSEAAVVTNLGQLFRGNSAITSFDELQYFIGLSFLGDYAFSYCPNLISLTLPNSIVSIGDMAFYECNSLTSLTIPNSVISIGYGAFELCRNLPSLTIPNSVTSIGNNAFAFCYGLTSMTIPNSVTSLGYGLFYCCSPLSQIVVEAGNPVYDSRENCNAIIETSTNTLVAGCKNTIIPNSVTSIGPSAFDGCIRNTTSLTIPNSVTSIGRLAFRYCSGLTSIDIPNSVIFIDGGAFDQCTGLTSITVLADNPPVLGNNTFSLVNKTIPVYVPCASMLVYPNTYGWNEFTNYMPATNCNSGEITITANPTEGGIVTGAGYYEGGDTCTLTATANEGYSFVNWTKEGMMVSNSETFSFIVGGDASYVANFIAMPPLPVIAEYYPDPNEPNSPYVKVHWVAGTEDVIIGDANSTINTPYMPFYTNYDNSISEALYTAAELIEAGATAGPITSLSWEAIEVTTNQTQNNISIWMANVPDTELTTASHLASNMTLVYTGNIGIPPLGWNEFVFNESNFVWDGTNNVLILCQRNNGRWNGSVKWRSHNPGFYGMAYKYQDNTPYDATSQSYTLSISNTIRPNIIMKGEGAMTYNIYRANCDGTNTQLIAENVSDSQFIDETWWQLENDSYKYGVSIADSTNTDIFWSNCIEKQGDVAVQTCALSQGTNWFSTYLDITLEDLQNALNAALPEATSMTIKSKNSNCRWNGTIWRAANGFTWDVASMYRIEVPEACVLTLTGMLIDPAQHPITIAPNTSTWIGFPLSESMTLNEAFPNGFAVSGDVIKGKDGNARYTGVQWRTTGNLNALEPGKGYMYNSNASGERTLVFPTGTK